MRGDRRLSLTLLLGGAFLLGTGPAWVEPVVRRIPWFDVRRVEVTGTKLLSPREVVEAAGIRPGQHLLDDSVSWEASLRAHPVIASAYISRVVPHTLRIRIAEKQPVALVSDGVLRLATAAGEVLPIAPHEAHLDLPIVHGSLADSARAAVTRGLLAEVGRLGSIDPALMAEVSEVRALAGASEAMVLTLPTAEVVLPFGADALRLRELRHVLADTERRFPRADSLATAKHRLDLRFADQVVVRPSSIS